MGRIMIPVKLRDKMGLVTGQEYDFITLEKDGRSYICIDCGPAQRVRDIEEAIRIIKANGMKVIRDED